MNVVQWRIIELAFKRIPPNQIAKSVCKPLSEVNSAIRSARRKGADIPPFPTTPQPQRTPASYQIIVPLRLKTLLYREAEKVGKSPNEFAQQLLEIALLGKWAKHARK